jgi:hypothetical protein
LPSVISCVFLAARGRVDPARRNARDEWFLIRTKRGKELWIRDQLATHLSEVFFAHAEGANSTLVQAFNVGRALGSHHRHIEGVEEVYEFVNVEGLIADFIADLSRVTGARE